MSDPTYVDVLPPENVDAVVFAYYGVLAPPAPPLGEMASAAVQDPAFAADAGLSATPNASVAHLLPLVGYALDQRADAVVDADCHMEPAATVVYETLLAMSGEPPSQESVASLVETFGHLEALPMDDECVSIVRALRDSGLALGLMCNCLMPGQFLRDRWAAGGLDTLFDHVMLTADWGWCLPHPSVFREVLDGLECQPDEVLVVCRDFRTHLQGAEALGLRTVWLRPDLDRRVEQVGQSYVIRELDVLLDWFGGSI